MSAPRAIEVLPPTLAGAYAYLNACFIRDDEAGSAPVVDEMVATQVTRYASSLGPCDRRAAASMWWQYYVSFLLPPLVALRLTAPTTMPATFHPRFGDNGLVQNFAVQGCGRQDGSDWFDALISDQLAPVVDTLQRFTGVARRALWANAASRLDGLCTHLATLPVPYRGAAAQGRALLAAPCQERSIASLGAMLREGAPRVCCLRYRLPGFVLCGNCPRETLISRGTPATSGHSTV